MRLSEGARVIQLPSGCMPMISECACWAICRISVLRYAVGHPVARLDLLVGGDDRVEVVLESPLGGRRGDPAAVSGGAQRRLGGLDLVRADAPSGPSSGPAKSFPYTS